LLIVGAFIHPGCGTDSKRGPNGSSDAGDMSNAGDAGNANGGSGAEGDGGACVPLTCAGTNGCGNYPDGCGGSLICNQSCSCTEGDFETTCPQRPCERVAGCNDSLCVYAPIECGGEACHLADCSGAGCEPVCTDAACDTALYPCGGDVCAGVA